MKKVDITNRSKYSYLLIISNYIEMNLEPVSVRIIIVTQWSIYVQDFD